MWQTFEFFSGYGFNKCLSFSEMVAIYNSDGEKIGDEKIKDVQVGCFVRSRDEKTGKDIFVRVKDNHHNGKKKVFKFTLDDGRTIKCTKDHKFRTKCGQMLTIQQILEKDLEIL
jgi:DNA polymerase-3 subunit alpha